MPSEQLLVHNNQLWGCVSLANASIIQINSIQCEVLSMIGIWIEGHHEYVKHSWILMCQRERRSKELSEG